MADGVMIVVHQAQAQPCLHHPRLEGWLKGEHRLLLRDGVVDEAMLRRSGLSRQDLLEGVRHSAQVDAIEDVVAAYVDSNGDISAVKR